MTSTLETEIIYMVMARWPYHVKGVRIAQTQSFSYGSVTEALIALFIILNCYGHLRNIGIKRFVYFTP